MHEGKNLAPVFFCKDDLRKEWPCESEASIFVSIHMTQTLAFFVLLVEMNEIAPNNTKPKLLSCQKFHH